MGLQINQPLFLLLLLPAYFLLFLYWRKNSSTPLFEKYTILVIRLLIFTSLIFALSVPQILYAVKGITTVFVIDRSESVKNQEGVMFGEIEKAIETMKPEDRYAIVSVSEDADIVKSISSKEKSIGSTNEAENTSFTNLEAGLQLASSFLSDEKKGRIVLLSDGNENMGDVKQQVKLLTGQQISVDVLPFYPSIEKDVAIASFHAPSSVYKGENAKLSITISSTVDTTSRLRITKDNETVIDEEIHVKQGNNSYSFNHLIKSTGNHSFKAEIIMQDDDIPQNNQYFAITSAKGPPSILIVVEEDGEGDNLFGALKASGLQVKKTKPKLLPTTLDGYLEYESIIFSNISATDITEEQMEMMESAVRDFGVGFIMTGGNKSFGLGGYFKTPIERLLPVDMDLKGKKELPSLGLVIVLDRSGSMQGQKLDLAKEAAARSVELLREKDTLGFIAFDDRPWEIIETGPLHNKEEAAEKIRSVTPGGGTEIFKPLQSAYEQLEPLKLQRKHIILLTDGQSATNNSYHELISQGLDNNVTLSTVAIGNDADRTFLEQLATEGTGRFYDVQDATTIPSILSRETVLTTRTYIEDNPFYPKYAGGNNWAYQFQDGVPEMNAYVATDPKSRAETILFSEKDDPILSRWKYGLGNTVAWTSDIKGEWAGNWPSWANWPSLWNDIITWSLPSYQNDMYDVTQSIEGKNIMLDISSVNHDMLPIEANVLDEKGSKVDAKIRVKAPGKHEVTFIGDTGIYFLNLTKMDGEDVVGSFKTGIVVPYSKEFAHQNQNEALLEEIVEIGQGKFLSSSKDAFRDIDVNKYEKQPIFIPLLLIAFLLFFIEIAIRRFGLTVVTEKMKSRRLNQKRTKTEKITNIEQTYTRLKKATSTKSRQVKQVVQTKNEENVRERSTQLSGKDVKKRKQEETEIQQNDSSDRLKRLLEAKKRSNR